MLRGMQGTLRGQWHCRACIYRDLKVLLKAINRDWNSGNSQAYLIVGTSLITPAIHPSSTSTVCTFHQG